MFLLLVPVTTSMNTFSRIIAIFWKEVIQLRRDRMTFGMVIMIPLIQLILFAYAINTNVRHIPVGILDYNQSALSRILKQTVEATSVVEFKKSYSNVLEANKALASGEVKAILIVPHDVDNRLVRHASVGLGMPASTDEETSRPIAQWLVDGSDTVIASAIKSLRAMPLTELLDQPANRYTPTFEVTLLFNPEQRTAVNVVPGLVGIILTMTMIMFTSTAIVREKERGNLELLITTPIASFELMIGKIIPYIFIGCLQTIIILGLGYLLFNIPFNGQLAQLAIATLLFIIASLTLGLIISTIASNQLQSTQMTIFVLLPSILLSGFMFPFEGMPKLAQTIAEIFPATHFMRLIRGVVLKDASVVNMPFDILWLICFSLIGVIIASIRFRKNLD